MAGPLAISLPRLRAHLETLARFGRNPDGKGITRSCWSPAHEEARAWLLDRMKEAGLSTWVDEAGNTFGRLGNGGPAVVTGCQERGIMTQLKHLGLAAEAQVISCSVSRCITARKRRRALQVRANAGADGARPGSFVVLYRTTHPDIAVQDTER